jgi:predicted TPR repeat methyltransferase
MNDKNKKAVEIYDKIAEEYSKNFDCINSEDDLVFLNTFLSHLQPNSHIVDIGCGTGFSAGYFVNKGMKVEGSDLSSSMIAIAKRNYPEIIFSVADMRKFSPKEKADAVWAGYSLFHFEQKDFEKTIKQIRTYLKPEGIFGLVMQEGEGELERDEPFLPEEKIYLHLYTEDQLRSILEKYGFNVIEQKRKTPLHPNEFPYNKLLLIAKRNKSTLPLYAF